MLSCVTSIKIVKKLSAVLLLWCRYKKYETRVACMHAIKSGGLWRYDFLDTSYFFLNYPYKNGDLKFSFPVLYTFSYIVWENGGEKKCDRRHWSVASVYCCVGSVAWVKCIIKYISTLSVYEKVHGLMTTMRNV